MNERPPVTQLALVRAQALVTVAGVILSVTTEAVGPSPALRCVLADGSGRIDLLFLGREGIAGLEPGRRCAVTGRAAARRGRLVIWNPRYELEPPGAPLPVAGLRLTMRQTARPQLRGEGIAGR